MKKEEITYKKNDIIEVEIVDYSNEGEGIGKTGAFTWFIKDTVIGDKIEAVVMKLKKNYGYARLVKILTKSQYRVEPACKVARACGGCSLQSTSYDMQLKFKEKKVISNLSRIGAFEENTYIYDGIIGMEEPFRYRNKAIYPLGKDKNGELVSGFYASRSHNIIKVDDCLLGIEENKKILDIILEYMKSFYIEAYDEINHRGVVRNILIRKGFYTGQIMVCLVINANKLDNVDSLIKELIKVEGVSSISLSINKEKTNVIMGKDIVPLYGNTYIEDYIGDIKFRISALSFFQVNPSQTYKLYSKALEYAALSGKEIVWDLYCGIGSISLFLARSAKKVYGIEIIEAAIDDARQNASINKIDNAEFYVGKAEEVLPSLYNDFEKGIKTFSDKEIKNKFAPDVIVVDPPRKGCDKACLDTMLKMQAKRIVYVSCDTATLARDARYLCDRGYKLERVCIVDQFGHTGHVEGVALLCRKDINNHIEVKLELDEEDITKAESKGTYENIKEYVLDNYGFKVSTLYIAQIKRKCGLELGGNYNKSKKENSKVPECPKEKEDAIMDALRHFGMIVQEG